MQATLRSIWTWGAVSVLILVWLPALVLMRLLDPDPVHYRTGRLFRRLGVAMTKVNPSWQLSVTGHTVDDPRRPYVVVSNHQSMADIPLISHLPWEMKWVAKIELFRLPIVGWMLRLAGDIPVERTDPRSGARTILEAGRVLERKCSVMLFPEGTRSPDGRVGRFNDGAFHLAIRSRVPVLPLVIEGSRDCLPKKTWKFGPPLTIRLAVLPPVETDGLVPADAPGLRDRVREQIVTHLAAWRGQDPREVDILPRSA